ncbi:hypothetical protein [Cryptosporangium japonicum]|uniref:C2H2-type domain-containing protein n=1 Tax=Cryptosporangium japonicum TaxID=80872 RepID=A0ABP3ENN3_9ACTN
MAETKVVTLTVEFTLGGRKARNERVLAAGEAAVEAATAAFRDQLLDGGVTSVWSASRYDYRKLDQWPLVQCTLESEELDEELEEVDDDEEVDVEELVVESQFGATAELWSPPWVSWGASKRTRGLTGAGSAHRRSGKTSARTLCGLGIPTAAAVGDQRPIGVTSCGNCAEALGRVRRTVADAGRADTVDDDRSGAVAATNGIRRSWTPDWAVWNPSWRSGTARGANSAHRVSIETPTRTMCGFTIPTSATGGEQQPDGVRVCRDCARAFRRTRQSAARVHQHLVVPATDRVARGGRRRDLADLPPNYGPDLESEVSVRAYSGGLPGLGERT